MSLGLLGLPEPLALPERLDRLAPVVALSALQVLPAQPERVQLGLQARVRQAQLVLQVRQEQGRLVLQETLVPLVQQVRQARKE